MHIWAAEDSTGKRPENSKQQMLNRPSGLPTTPYSGPAQMAGGREQHGWAARNCQDNWYYLIVSLFLTPQGFISQELRCSQRTWLLQLSIQAGGARQGGVAAHGLGRTCSEAIDVSAALWHAARCVAPVYGQCVAGDAWVTHAGGSAFLLCLESRMFWQPATHRPQPSTLR